jgi:HEAT repeat protein
MRVLRLVAVGFVLLGGVVGCGKVDRVQRLTTILQNETGNKVERAKDELIRIGQPAVGPVLRLLKHEDSAVRIRAIEVLEGIGDPEAVEPLIAALKDSPDVREAAAAALGKMNDPRAVRPLIKLLGTDSVEAPVALARLSKYSLGPIEECMRQNPSPFPYDAGLWIMEQTGKVCIPSLIRLLRTTASPERKCKLLTVIARIARADATEPLVAALRDRNLDVRYAAFTALKQVADYRAVQPLARIMQDQAHEARWLAAEILVAIGKRDPDAVKSITDVLEKNDLRAVAKNYAFFIKLGRPGTERTLVKALYRYGNKRMCLDYLNCGNETLDQAGHHWAKLHGYIVYSLPGHYEGPRWGEGL